MSQLLAYTVLAQMDFEKHVLRVQDVYTKRRNTLLDALDHHVGALASWNEPQCGMFIWLRVPDALGDTRPIVERLVAAGCATVYGSAYAPQADASPFIRLTFANASDEQMAVGAERLAAALKKTKYLLRRQSFQDGTGLSGDIDAEL